MVHDACLGAVGTTAECVSRRACGGGGLPHAIGAAASTVVAFMDFAGGHGANHAAHAAHEAHALHAVGASSPDLGNASSFISQHDVAAYAPAFPSGAHSASTSASRIFLAPTPAARSLATDATVLPGPAAAGHQVASFAASSNASAAHASEFLAGPASASHFLAAPVEESAAMLHTPEVPHVTPAAFLFVSDTTSHTVASAAHAAHPGHAGHVRHIFTEEQLSQRRTQLAVAFGIAGSMMSLSVGAFATLVVKLASKKVKDRERAEGAGESESDQSEEEGLGDGDEYEKERRLAKVDTHGRFASVAAAQKALDAGKPEDAIMKVPVDLTLLPPGNH